MMNCNGRSVNSNNCNGMDPINPKKSSEKSFLKVDKKGSGD